MIARESVGPGAAWREAAECGAMSRSLDLALAVALAGAAAAVACSDDPATPTTKTDPTIGEDGGIVSRDDAAGLPDVRQQDPPLGPCTADRPFMPKGLLEGTRFVADQAWPKLSRDETVLVFTSTRLGPANVYMSTRESAAVPFPTGALRSDFDLGATPPAQVALGPDGLSAVFTRTTPPATDSDLMFTKRDNAEVGFEPATALSDVNETGKDESMPFVSLDGSTLYFVSNRTGTPQIHASDKVSGKFAGRRAVLEASAEESVSPVLSADGLLLYFSANRAGTLGGRDIFVASRPTAQAPFGPAARVAELSSARDDYPGWLSPDGCRLYYHTKIGAEGRWAVYLAERAR